jgi:uncharacterized protein (TIRG00374 family)
MKRAIQTLVGLAVSAGALWLTLRGKDLGAIWAAMRAADYRYLLPYFVILVAIHLIRTVRWGILLEPVAKVGFWRLNAASAVGIMLLVLLPFRLGEFGRPYMIAERPRLRVSAALSSVVVERVADGIITAVLLIVTLLAVPPGTPGLGLLRAGGVVVFLIFGGLLALLVLAYRNRALAVRITHRLADPISPKLAEKASGMMDAFIQGLRLVPSRSKVFLFFFLTFVYWAVNGWGLQILARGFGFDIGLIDAYTVLGVLVVGVMIPAGPGMIGTFQAAVVLALSLFYSQEAVGTRGNAYANVLWAAQMGQQVLFGMAFLFSKHIQLDRIFKTQDEMEAALDQEQASG